MVVAVMLATVAAAPFLDALAWRAERLATGAVVESDESGMGALVRDVGRSIAGEARRLGFFLAITAILLGLGFVVPGAHVITGPAMVAVTILFLPLEYSGYVLDRRRVPFASRRRWIVGRWPRMAGFGAAAFAICFVPGVNLLMIPGLVVAGTLLVLDGPPAQVGPGIDPGAAPVGRPRESR
jgi:CysZ protein